MSNRDNTVMDLSYKGMLHVEANAVTGGSGATTTAATLNNSSGLVTTASSTAAAAATHTLTLTNNLIEVGDLVFANVATSGNGSPIVGKITVTAGQVVIVINNVHASAAFNAALVIGFFVVKRG